uniref:Retrotransposon Copia-like N-terminal domain-containing protein n=1 Tax=Triticum urartu TaxID=4572 RepID=A0A8R7QLT1_TRIUA
MATPSIASLGHTITEKLTRENFLVWKARVLPHIKGAGLMGYLDGSIKEPAAVVHTEKDSAGKKEITSSPTPEHAVWVTQDQQILPFFISSLSREVLLQVSSHTTAASIWNALLQSFSSQSRARVIQLCSAIEHTRKGDMTAVAYFTMMVSISDELAAAGKPLDEDDVVDHILQGLLHEPDYNGFVSAISTRT